MNSVRVEISLAFSPPGIGLPERGWGASTFYSLCLGDVLCLAHGWAWPHGLSGDVPNLAAHQRSHLWN